MNTWFVVAGALSLSPVPSVVAAEDERPPFTRELPVETCESQTTGSNPYFALRPGHGVIVSHEGAWLAGQDDAEPGIIMPGGAFLLGSRYFQEHAPGVALDRAERVGVDLDVEVPAGAFEDCVKVRESTPLDPGETSTKIYCPGTGVVVDDDLELEGSFGTGPSASKERR